ncbi:MAG: lytic transglycosylase domain-containing protein, partial [Bdellovibrionales bacterium]|nr:lytic transglycosylase domain-containing protein [Bdellovibrionales bacterium]
GLKGIPVLATATKKHSFFESLRAQDKAKVVHYVNFVTAIVKKRNPALLRASDLSFLVVTESFKAQVDPLFAAAVIAAESNFDAGARSHVGARGLMQVMPPTGAFVSETARFRWRGGSSLYDAQTNLQLGLQYIRSLFHQSKGDLNQVLMSYNWGPGNAQRFKQGRARMPEETRRYMAKVMGLYKQWQLDFLNHKAKEALALS